MTFIESELIRFGAGHVSTGLTLRMATCERLQFCSISALPGMCGVDDNASIHHTHSTFRYSRAGYTRGIHIAVHVPRRQESIGALYAVCCVLCNIFPCARPDPEIENSTTNILCLCHQKLVSVCAGARAPGTSCIYACFHSNIFFFVLLFCVCCA